MTKSEAFLEAIEQNRAFIYKIAAAYTDSPEDRQDLVQEILFRLWKSFDTFKEKSSLSTWMYRVALNVAIYGLKKSRKRIQTVQADPGVLNYAEKNKDEEEEKWKLFREQIAGLNLLDKSIVMLYLDNKSHEEIAEIIGITKTNVGTKLSRIKEKLKQQINKNYNYGIR